MSGRRPVSAAFEPERLKPRRRRFDPVLVGAAIVVLGLAAAVVKPWAGDDAADPETAAGSRSPAVAGASPTASPSVAEDGPAAAPGTVRTTTAISWPRAAAAIEPHDAWGIRAVVRELGPDIDLLGGPGVGTVIERWARIETGPGGTERAPMPTADQAVLALGLTFPRDELPLDARIWRATADGGWEWLDAVPLERSPAFGAFLYGPPRFDDLRPRTWPPGRYRLQVLTGTAIRRIEVLLPGRFDNVPDLPQAGDRTASNASPLAPEFRLISSDRLFVVQDGVATPLPGGPWTPLDERAAWLDAWPAGRTEPREAARPAEPEEPLDIVPAIHAPRAAGLGVMLPVGATQPFATIRSLAPEETEPAARRATGVRVSDAGWAPFVIFRAPGSAPWAAGTYRIDASWTQDDRRQAAAYHVELRPGPGGDVPTLLAALRAFAPSSGGDAILGASGPYLDRYDLTCRDAPTAGVGPVPEVIGLAHPPGEAPSAVRADLRLSGGRSMGQDLLLARDAVPGMTLLVPDNGDAFLRGVYRLAVGRGAEARRETICAGVTLSD